MDTHCHLDATAEFSGLEPADALRRAAEVGVPRLVRLITVPEVSSPGEAMPDDTAPNEAAPLLPWLLTTAQRDHGRCGAPVSEVTLERWQRLDAALRRELEVALGAPALRPVALALCETLVWWWTLRGEAAVEADVYPLE